MTNNLSSIGPESITIDPEFRDLIRPLSESERNELTDSLRSCGMLSPIIYWQHEGQNILVDGHNRLSLWIENNGFNEEWEFKSQEIFLGKREYAREWIIKNQLGRRNLTRDEFTDLVGLLYNSRKKARGGCHGNQHTPPKDQNDTLPDTADQVAAETGVSPATVKRAGKLADAADEVQSEEPELPRSEAVKKAKEAVKAKAEADKPKKLPKYIPALAVDIANNAIRMLGTINHNDTRREEALIMVRHYCESMLAKNAPVTSEGMAWAEKAIKCLEKIQHTDTEKKRAYRHVSHWLSLRSA